MIFEFKKKIYGYECDIYGHMNNANYLMMLEAARSDALVEMGMPITQLLKMNIQLFVLRYELDYLKALELEDMVTVKSWFYEINRLKGFWKQEVYDSRGELCFVANFTVVHASEGKAKRLSPEIFERLKKFLEQE
ncbi:MAG: acyl-CoA thioesterase [Candidatus Cloacimonetes bacterium]|jgi:YbgC/YbaW family acyl-CoA thioester hydrolase|nr:acyl-CoA thioesterase [Candidatus Cloacimonadota bacterium]MDD2423759.1 acyl-CoA thioesterase [Candidatus Cloacimonadota bacterium]MDD3562119.1 acyl-CoA thioesterase [Candidatus Cloacimonadota bacterium]MDD4276762.1 acyl-CoA thioesterase [Candidatus Cloacimonadota bacterium]MDY0325613.1 acyl-CoA thioesterase [Candidatus Cloacimonadaceae bacterium]